MTDRITIRCSAGTITDAMVCYAGGRPISGIRSIDIHMAEGYINTAKIEVIPDSIDVDARGHPLTCRHDGEEYVLVPRDHWERVQRRLDELREGENA